jgi:hypothetical protein
MAETRDVQHYNPEEANRQLRSQLQETVKEVRQGGKWLVRAQLAVAAATILATVCTGVTAWLTYEQIVAVRDATKQAQQQFNLSQRPWVAATDLRITDVEIGKKPRAVMRLTNKGLTPAKFRPRLDIRIFRELPTAFPFPDVPQASIGILLPDSSASLSVDYDPEISEQIMTSLNNGELLLVAYGVCAYEDPRGNTYPPTRFCAVWDPKTKTHALCSSHNTVE